jgi:hypothetical protein
MELDTFNKILEKLRPLIVIDAIKSMNSTPDASEPIYSELVMAVGIRWLAGGSYLDIHNYCGISMPSCYRLRDMILDALISADGLKITWPSSSEQLNHLARGFEQKSTHGVLSKCVGAIDDILVKRLVKYQEQLLELR